MLPQQPTGLVLVLLGDDLPALISQQCHKQPTRRIPHPPRMHSGSHHVELGRLAALQPAARDRVLVQGEQTGHIAKVGKDHVAQGWRCHVGRRVGTGWERRMGNLGDVWWWGAWRWRSPWLGRCHGCLGDGGSLHGLRSPRQAVCSLLTGVLLALQRRFPRPSGRTICLARRAPATPRVCHRRPPPAGAFTSSCPGRVRVPRHAAAR